MAEKTKSNEETTQEAKPGKGLSVSLLIKVAIGLALLLVALIVSVFLLPQSADPETESAEETVISPIDEPDADNKEDSVINPIEPEQTSVANDLPSDTADNVTLPDLPASVQSEAIEPPATDTAAGIDPSAAIAATGALTASPQATGPSSAALLAEIVVLQQQITALKEENQKLIKQIEKLSSDKSNPSAEPSQQKHNPVPEDIINDDRLVNIGDVPAYSRNSRYTSTPQPKLAPKWGDFDEYNSDG